MGEDSGEKTEEPTPHKLREAREKGQVAKSKDLTASILLLASFYTMKYFAENIWMKSTQLLTFCFSYISNEFSASIAGFFLKLVLDVFFATLLPFFMVNIIVALFMEVSQTGFILSFHTLEPSLDKLNPIEGFKKFFSLKQYVELVKSVIKMILVVVIIYFSIKEEIIFLILSMQMPLWA